MPQEPPLPLLRLALGPHLLQLWTVDHYGLACLPLPHLSHLCWLPLPQDSPPACLTPAPHTDSPKIPGGLTGTEPGSTPGPPSSLQARPGELPRSPSAPPLMGWPDPSSECPAPAPSSSIPPTDKGLLRAPHLAPPPSPRKTARRACCPPPPPPMGSSGLIGAEPRPHVLSSGRGRSSRLHVLTGLEGHRLEGHPAYTTILLELLRPPPYPLELPAAPQLKRPFLHQG